MIPPLISYSTMKKGSQKSLRLAVKSVGMPCLPFKNHPSKILWWTLPCSKSTMLFRIWRYYLTFVTIHTCPGGTKNSTWILFMVWKKETEVGPSLFSILSADILLWEGRRNAQVEMAHSHTEHISPHPTIKYAFQFVPTSENLFVAIQSSSCDGKDLGDVVESVDEYSVPWPFALLTIHWIPQLGKMKPPARPLIKVGPHAMYFLILQMQRRRHCPRTATIPPLSSSCWFALSSHSTM